MAMLENIRLSYESNLPSLAGATEWLNSEPLTAADLRGHVVVDFWTFTCINWIRTAPYRRAWDEKYREHGLTVIGVHTPEFPFETDVDSIRGTIDERGIAYPVAVDSDYAIWNAFANSSWPALYVADVEGAIAFHHFGEGRYGQSERVIQALLDEAGGLVEVEGEGVEAATDWAALASPETYLGYERAERFASPDLLALAEPHTYTTPSRLRLNPWALSGTGRSAGRPCARTSPAGGCRSASAHATSTWSWDPPKAGSPFGFGFASTETRRVGRAESTSTIAARASLQTGASISSSASPEASTSAPSRSRSSSEESKGTCSPSARSDRAP